VTSVKKLLAVGLLASTILVAVGSSASANHNVTERISVGPTGGNGAVDASFRGASLDGTRVFFTTNLPLVAADTDSAVDVYERYGSNTTLVSTGSLGGNGDFAASYRGASADGTHVFFETDEALASADTDIYNDVYERAGGTTTLISTGSIGGTSGGIMGFVQASADGTRVLFFTNERMDASDTDSFGDDIYERAGATTTLVSTGPTAGTCSGCGQVVVPGGASLDATRVVFATNDQLVSTDTDTNLDVYERVGGTTTLLSPGPAGAQFAGLSADGTHVVFTTGEHLDPADTDARVDIYEWVGGVISLVSTGPTGGNGAFDPTYRGISADGTHVFFTTDESLVPGDTDANRDVYERAGGTTALVSIGPSGNGTGSALYSGSSSDGTRVFFITNESLVPGDTDSDVDIYERTGGTTALVSTGPAGGNGGFASNVFERASTDGTRVLFTTSESLVAADNDGRPDVYERAGGTTTLISTGPTDAPSPFSFNVFRGISADGTRVFFETGTALVADDGNNSQDVYVARFGGYPRPQAASPLKVSLVPAYQQCTASNRTHGPPLVYPSCNPPALESAQLTMGSPDANGQPLNASGYARYRAIVGAPGGADESDVAFALELTDVRSQGTLADYTGELQALTVARITDRLNGTAPNDAGTVNDIPFPVTVPCTASGGAASLGATCAVTTSFDAVTPGAIPEGKRSVWELGQVQVLDGGPDSDADTTPNTVFARQGVFVP
jgi:Tol biopolymer transport system component